MLDPVILSTPFVLSPSTTITAFSVSYAYVFPDHAQIYFEPSIIPPFTIGFSGGPFTDGGNTIVVDGPTESALSAALTPIILAIQNRLENYPGP